MFHLLNQGRTVCDDVHCTPSCIVYTRWKQNMTAFFVIRLYTKKIACSRDTLQMTADISISTSKMIYKPCSLHFCTILCKTSCKKWNQISLRWHHKNRRSKYFVMLVKKDTIIYLPQVVQYKDE